MGNGHLFLIERPTVHCQLFAVVNLSFSKVKKKIVDVGRIKNGNVGLSI